jgi:hypothetical protein
MQAALKSRFALHFHDQLFSSIEEVRLVRDIKLLVFILLYFGRCPLCLYSYNMDLGRRL